MPAAAVKSAKRTGAAATGTAARAGGSRRAQPAGRLNTARGASMLVMDNRANITLKERAGDVEKGLPTPGTPLQFDTAGPKTCQAAGQAFGRSGVRAFGQGRSTKTGLPVTLPDLNA